MPLRDFYNALGKKDTLVGLFWVPSSKTTNEKKISCFFFSPFRPPLRCFHPPHPHPPPTHTRSSLTNDPFTPCTIPLIPPFVQIVGPLLPSLLIFSLRICFFLPPPPPPLLVRQRQRRQQPRWRCQKSSLICLLWPWMPGPPHNHLLIRLFYRVGIAIKDY